MNDMTPPAPASAPARAGTPNAAIRRSRVSLVWLIPVVAAVIAAWLGWRTVSQQGTVITLSFRSADGLTAGTTRVRHKAVDLGQVETIRLSDDMSKVNVTVRMRTEAEPYLSSRARFWVVRPRISSGSLAGIETLVSGSYIEMDPGGRDGERTVAFTGLEQPPGVRSGEPGRTFALKAQRIGSLGPGAPVFYRDITVGEVLGYDIGNGIGPVTVQVFVRAPFDGFVREGSHFWNASGLSVQVGGEGVRVEVASLQAVLSGGVAFDTPRNQPDARQLPAGTEFPLYRNYAEAQASGYSTKQDFVTYFGSSVRGLTTGASVEFFGIQVGTVNEVALDLNEATGEARVRVRFEVQPERVLGVGNAKPDEAADVARRLVSRGMRTQLKTASFLTGQMVLALDFVPNATPAELVVSGDDVIIPSQSGGLDNILTAVSDIAGKLDRLPLEEIGQNLNGTLRSTSGAMASIDALVTKTDAGLTPTLRRLPEITAGLQDAVTRATRAFGSLDASYGNNSQFNRELGRAMTQVGDSARSIRLLADFLNRNPEALVRGRTGEGSAR
ncbi:MAG: MCE family protein [Gemmatimonadaceae bacterium]|nr:MCE family protein [Acetobacteraceae bacterium]